MQSLLRSIALLLCGVGLLAVSSGTVGAQDSADIADSLPTLEEPSVVTDAPPAPEDVPNVVPVEPTRFIRIELSSDGVTAQDSLGRYWHYDFTRDGFVEGAEPFAGSEGGVAGEERADPVETRCTDLLDVPRPALDPVFVGYDEFVDGDIQAYDRVTIKGWVRGSVRSVNSRVLVSATGQVDGDIEAPEIIVKPGAQVLGQQIISESPTFSYEIVDSFTMSGVWVLWGLYLFCLLCAMLMTVGMPKMVGNIIECGKGHVVKSYLMGFLFVFLLPAIIVLMALSIVGIPLIPLLPFAMVLCMVVCMIAFGQRLKRTRWLAEMGWSKHRLLDGFIGVTFFALIWLPVALLLGSSNPVAEGFGIACLVIAILITSSPMFCGIGAAILTRAGMRRYESFRSSVDVQQPSDPTPPPMPPPPTQSGHSDWPTPPPPPQGPSDWPTPPPPPPNKQD